MIKLIDILKEVVENTPTPEEQKVINDLLGSLNEGSFDTLLAKAKKYAKKGLLTATVLTALMASPELSSAQKNQVKDLTKTSATTSVTKDTSADVALVQASLQDVRKVMISQFMKGEMGIKLDDRRMDPKNQSDVDQVDKRFMPIAKEKSASGVGTTQDGIIGEYTSKYKFPLQASDTTTTITKNQGQVVNIAKTGREVTHTTMLQAAAKHGLSKAQMLEWNNFVDWMNTKGYAGNPKMNHIPFSKSVLEQYKKEVNPKFWIQW